jgi:hypothetical protein
MGRPPKPEDQKRTVRQQVLLTAAERKLLEEAAREVLSVPMGDVLREGGLRYAQNAIRRAGRLRKSR